MLYGSEVTVLIVKKLPILGEDDDTSEVIKGLTSIEFVAVMLVLDIYPSTYIVQGATTPCEPHAQ